MEHIRKVVGVKVKIEATEDGRQQEYRGIAGEVSRFFRGRFYLIREMVSRYSLMF